MSFSLENKVALVTGGVGGIGFNLVKDFLKKGIKGVGILDVNQSAGDAAIAEIEKDFGKNKAIFIKADVTVYEEFESAIKKVVETFGNFDILVNNAGFFNEYEYEKIINVNLLGTINGTYLALEKYIPKYRSGDEGVILNVSSAAGIEPHSGIPVYSASKFGINGLSLIFGGHYERTKVKVIAVCPGATTTPLAATFFAKESCTKRPYIDLYKELLLKEWQEIPVMQTPEFCSERIVKVVENAESGTLWIIDNDEPYQFVLPDRSKMEKVYLKGTK